MLDLGQACRRYDSTTGDRQEDTDLRRCYTLPIVAVAVAVVFATVVVFVTAPVTAAAAVAVAVAVIVVVTVVVVVRHAYDDDTS